MGQKPQVLGGRGVSGHEHDTDADGGEHISPESVDVGQVNRTFTAAPGDDINSTISNQMRSGDELVINGDHIITESIKPIAGITITVTGTVTVGNGAECRIIEAEYGDANGVTIRGPGTLDGNKANQTNRHEGVWLIGGDKTTVKNMEVKNTGHVGMNIGAGGRNKTIKNNYVHETGETGGRADGIFVWATDSEVLGNVVRNTTDAHIANDNCKNHTVRDNVCWNTDSYNSNVDTNKGSISFYANKESWSGNVEGNTVRSGNAYGISDVSDNGYDNDGQIKNNLIIESDPGIIINNSNGDTPVSGNTVQAGSVGEDGIFATVACSLSDNIVTGNTRNIRATSSGVTISDNEISGGTFGVYATAGDLDIQRNKIDGTANDSILVTTGAGSVTVEDNRIVNSSDGGIRCTDSAASRWNVGGNIIRGCNVGLNLSGDNHIITSNQIYNNTTNTDIPGNTNGVQSNNLIG